MSSTPHFSLRTSPAETLQVVISVSKKVSKKAVVRNTIRRRIRPLLKAMTMNLKPQAHLLIVRPGSEMLKGEALRQELALLFKKG